MLGSRPHHPEHFSGTMLKPKPDNWLKVCLILIPLLLITLVIVASDRAEERAENTELKNDSKERLEKIEKDIDNMYKQIKKLESSKKAAVKVASKPPGNQVTNAIYNKFGNRPEVVRLAVCESGLDPRAYNPMDTNGYWDAGIFQINGVHGQTPEYWFDVDRNIQKAWELSNGGTNWSPWPTCSRSVGLL